MNSNDSHFLNCLFHIHLPIYFINRDNLLNVMKNVRQILIFIQEKKRKSKYFLQVSFESRYKTH